MIIYKKITEEETHIEIDKAYCNKCGKEFSDDEMNFGAYVNFHAYHGYLSCRDGDTDESIVCYNCYDLIVKDFVYAPTLTESMWATIEPLMVLPEKQKTEK